MTTGERTRRVFALNDLYRVRGGVSDWQWYDAQGVLEVQGAALDFDYVQRWEA